MNSKFKRLLACLLSLMMVVSLFPLSAVTASAAKIDETNTVSENNNDEITVVDGGTWGGIDWTYTSDGTLTIAPTDNEITKTKPWSGELYQRGELPAAVNDDINKVTGWPYKGYTIKKLVIEEGVTSIGSFALSGATDRLTYASSIGEVVLPSTLTYVGQEGLQTIPMTKLTFAEGGTKELCFSAGSLKSLKVTELVFPADRPAICIHTWALNDCNQMKTLVFPANTTFKLYNHVDYFGNPNDTSSWDSQILARCWALENLVFGSEAAWESFKGGSGNTNNITAIGVTPKTAVALIGTTGYETLQAAINAASAGQTIDLIGDAEQNVTINKNLTINGNNYNYTGKMTVAVADASVTIKNVNFVKGSLYSDKGTSKGTTLKVINCDFEDQKSIDHAMQIRDIEQLIIEGGSVKNYKYSAVYVPSAHSKDVIINGTTFDGIGSYTIRIASGNGAQLSNVTIKNVYGGLLADTAKEYTFTNCVFENVTLPVTSWSGNLTGTFTFNGENEVPNLSTANGGTFVLASGNLTAPENLTITTNVEDGRVAYKNGKYYVQVGLAGSGTEADPYQIECLEDLIKFRNSVNAGETKYNAKGKYVVLTADIDLAGINWEPIGSPTAAHGFMGNFDGNGFKIKNLTINNPALDSDGYAYAGFFGITEGVDKNNQNTIKNLVIENVTIETSGHIVAAAIAYPYYTALENITVCGNIAIKGGDYTAGALAYTRRCVDAKNITVKGNTGSYITGAKTVGGVISDIQMNGGLTANYSNFSASGLTITGDMHVGGISGIICNQTLNGATVKNVKLVCSDARVGVVAGSLGGTATIKNVETSKVTGTKNIVGADFSTGKAVANKDDKYGIATAWINKVGYFLSLADAVEYVNGANKTSTTYIYLLCDSEGPGFVVKAPVQIEFEGYTYTITSGVGSTGTESNGIQQLSGKLVLRNGTLKVADSIASTMYILVQSYDDLSVIGMTLDGTNLDKWSKHEDQIVNGDSYVVSKNNGNFSINTSNIITNDDGSKAFAFDLCDQRAYGYMDLPYASVAATTTINGVPVKESLDKVEAAANYSIYYYATIEQAIAKHPSAALIGDVVLKDTVVIPEGKTFTLDLNGHTITMKTAEYKSAIENNGTLTIKDSGENGGIAMIFTGTPSTAKAVNTISNRGKLTVQGGNISNTGSGNQIGYAIDNYNGATLTVKGGNITASGSTYYDAIRLFCGSKETKVTVSGGYVSSIWAQNPSANKASEVNGSVVVTGGEIGTIYYENYTTVTITTKIAGNYNVVAYGANSENATSAKVAKNTVYSFAN